MVPVLFFVFLELGLTVAGVGTSYDFFHNVDINDRPHYQENPDFADQFYPSSLNIGPLENTFTVERDPDLVRVYVLGGSAAQGFPHKNHGFDRLLETQLEAALPSRKIEVINTAMTSVNSHVVYAVANSIPEDSADFAVVLMGNNEVVGPYGPGTFEQNFIGNIAVIRGLQTLKRTRIWQALDSDLIDWTHGHAVAVGVLKALIYPVFGFVRNCVVIQFAGSKHDLSVVTIEGVAIDIDIVKTIVKPQALQLLIGAQERSVAP